MMHLSSRQWFAYTIAFALMSALVFSIIYVRAEDSISSETDTIIKECAGAERIDACYEAAVPALYPRFSLDQVFDVIRSIRARDTSYQFCHVLAHKIGEKVVAEDPERWIDAIPLNPSDGLCSNGFIHGVTGGRFKAEVFDDATIDALIPDFRRACEPHDAWHPSELDRSICYHGLGHLFDFITDGDLGKALGICKRVTDTYTERVCVQGVFMQIFQPLEPDDFALIKKLPLQPSRENVRSLCAAYKQPLYVSSCLSESWPLFRDEIRSGTGVKAFCAGYPNAHEESQCYISSASIIGRTTLGDPDAAVAACNEFPAVHRASCFSFIAQAAIEEDLNTVSDAIELCERAEDAAGTCFESLVHRATFLFGGNRDARDRFCAALPTQYRASCARQ